MECRCKIVHRLASMHIVITSRICTSHFSKHEKSLQCQKSAFSTKKSAVISLSCKTPNKVKMLITELLVNAVCRVLLSQPVNFAFEACWC